MEDTKILAEKYERFSNGSFNSDDRLDKMIDAILTLRGLGLEPTGFTMDADTLYHFTNYCVTDEFINKFVDSWGGMNLEETLSKYNFSIMGIPIEPDFNGRVIKVRKKKEDE